MSSAGHQQDEWIPSASLISVAIRVYRLEAMVGFYQEAFGVQFEEKRVGDQAVYFGYLGDILLKLVPLSSEQDADEFPTHQLGVLVEDIDAVTELALKYGGRILQEPVLRMDQLHGAIRDPDGNSLELYAASALPEE